MDVSRLNFYPPFFLSHSSRTASPVSSTCDQSEPQRTSRRRDGRREQRAQGQLGRAGRDAVSLSRPPRGGRRSPLCASRGTSGSRVDARAERLHADDGLSERNPGEVAESRRPLATRTPGHATVEAGRIALRSSLATHARSTVTPVLATGRRVGRQSPRPTSVLPERAGLDPSPDAQTTSRASGRSASSGVRPGLPQRAAGALISLAFAGTAGRAGDASLLVWAVSPSLGCVSRSEFARTHTFPTSATRLRLDSN